MTNLLMLAKKKKVLTTAKENMQNLEALQKDILQLSTRQHSVEHLKLPAKPLPVLAKKLDTYLYIKYLMTICGTKLTNQQ